MWQKFTAALRDFGVIPGLLYLLDRILRRLSPHAGLYVYEFMVQPISRTPLLPERYGGLLKIVEIDRAHPDLIHVPAPAEIVAARFAQGARCIGVYVREKFVGYMWFCFNSYREDEVRCTYVLQEPSQSVFDFDFFVLPSYRLGIGFAALWQAANQYLSDRKVSYTFSRVTRFNVRSKKAHAHLGCKRVGQALFCKVGNFEIMFSTLAPFLSLSWAGRPQLSLSPAVLKGNQALSP